MANDQTLGLPQLALVAVLSGLAIRYFFFTPSTPDDPTGSASHSGPRSRTHANPVRDEDVERVLQMFPQLQRRHVMWDLHLNGGSVAATTERVLTGRGLAVPPPTYQPVLPAAASTSGSTSTTSRTTASTSGVRGKSKSSQPDLITRYNLQDKVSSSAAEPAAASDAGIASTSSTVSTSASASQLSPQRKPTAWSQNKNERQALLQSRREEMILQARRKMEEKLEDGGSEGARS